MATYFAVTKNQNGDPVRYKFLNYIRTNQDQFDFFNPNSNTHQNFRQALQNGWVRIYYNGDVYGIVPDENGLIEYSEILFDEGILPEENGNDFINENEGPIALSLERDLQNALIQRIQELEEGLNVIGRERLVISGGRIDILAQDPAQNHVVIELKAGTAKPEALAQILDYMADIGEEINTEVRGIIVAHDFDRRLQRAVTLVPQVQLKRYSIQFTFENV